MSPETELQRAPHPAVNMMATMPIPNPDTKRKGDPDEAVEAYRTPFGIIANIGSLMPEPGIVAAVVLQIGPLSVNDDEDTVVAWSEGATVWYSENAAIKVGGFHYVGVGAVICWDEPPS